MIFADNPAYVKEKGQNVIDIKASMVLCLYA
jgi:hypothetical protein